jgi:hypothetical protein
MTGDPREIWKPSPDSEEIRQHLLVLVSQIGEQPIEEYPLSVHLDEIVVWQLGEFRDERAIEELERICSFDPEVTTGEPWHRTRSSLVDAAREALCKIHKGRQSSESFARAKVTLRDQRPMETQSSVTSATTAGRGGVALPWLCRLAGRNRKLSIDGGPVAATPAPLYDRSLRLIDETAGEDVWLEDLLEY